MLTGLTNYLWAGGLALVLLAFGWQEVELRAKNAETAKELAAEVQCLKGSQCADRLLAESARGATLVAAARAEASAALAAQKAALAKQTADVIQSLEQYQGALQRSLVTAQAKLAAAEKTSPTCAQWAKEAVQCATQ